jgi:phosphoribosylamine---glycine ligase
MSKRVATIGKSGRLHAIARALMHSVWAPKVYMLSDVKSPGLAADATEVIVGVSDNEKVVADFVDHVRPDLVVIGPEEPLAAGIVDMLIARGIPCVGPIKKLAKLESSKVFTRTLIADHKIAGNPEYQIFTNSAGIKDYLHSLSDFVIKPDGLTGGKGVKVSGEHLDSITAAFEYCEEILKTEQPVIIEEKLDGEEFSYQSFFDGRHIAHTIPVQDHKRAFEGDVGPNTGGMGSYSCPDHLLPFLEMEHIIEAQDINRRVGEALYEETGQEYKGILYGGFMLTKKGLRVIEYNARFGDPEAMNVLPLMETDFLDVCEAITQGTLNKLSVRFKKLATVCKYVVPKEYPGKVSPNQTIDVSQLEILQKSEDRLRVYYGAVDGESYRLTGSRAIALVGVAATLPEAEYIAEKAACSIVGPVRHRLDIGTSNLIQKRKDHMSSVCNKHSKSLEKAPKTQHLKYGGV